MLSEDKVTRLETRAISGYVRNRKSDIPFSTFPPQRIYAFPHLRFYPSYLFPFLPFSHCAIAPLRLFPFNASTH